MLTKLITINGENRDIEFKTAIVSLSSGNKIKFDTPFKNACLIVLFLDMGQAFSNQRILNSDNIFKDGFIAYTSMESGDTAGYLAIGY